MGRKNTKKPGALVKLYRRKTPGLGIITEVTDTDQMKQFIRDKFKVRFKSTDKIRERLGFSKLHEYRRTGKITEEQYKKAQSFLLYALDDQTRRMGKVQWFQQPSAWETEISTERVDWYPFDMLRTVSAVKPNEK